MENDSAFTSLILHYVDKCIIIKKLEKGLERKKKKKNA